MDFEVHTDGSAIWIDCTDCEQTVVEFDSLPVEFQDMQAMIRDHRPVCGMGDDDDAE